MNKKMISALVLGALIISTSVVSTTYAAGLQLPGDGKLGKLGDDIGDNDKENKGKDVKKEEKKVTVHLATKSELKYDADHNAKMKHEGKLYIDGRIDDMFTAEVGLNIETKTDNAKQSETEKWEMENIWLEYKKTPEFSVKFGRQTYHLAKGLFVDQDGVFGGKSIYKLDKNNTIELFAGRDDQDRDKAGLKLKSNGTVVATDASKTTLIEVLNLAHKFDKHSSIGTYMAKQGRQDSGETDRFWGLYGNYGVAYRTDLNFEYLKNNFTDKSGYVAELKYGKLKKAGDYTYALEYMDVDANLMQTNNYTDFDSQIDPTLGFKGPGAIVMTKLSKNSQLQLQRWWGRDKANTVSLPVTKLILYVKF